MDNGLQPLPSDADPATAAFARLAEEVGVVRRLVAANDNSATLGEIVQRLDRMVDAINVLARRPAIKLTPDQMADQIAAAGEKARTEDSVAIKQARERMEKTAKELDSAIGKVATIREQRQRLTWIGGGGLLAGILLMSFTPGMIAREMPASWDWPERMAAHVLRLDRWGAGERMLATADATRWRAVLLGNHILEGNQETIAKCLGDSLKSGRPVACAIRITAGG